MLCEYSDTRDSMLVGYLYDDMDPADRAAFDAHLARCEPCRAELVELRAVRAQLGRWSPPEPVFGSSPQPPASRPRWRAVPVWAQVAAASLFIGVAAGIANVDVRYDRDGVTVRTGWSKAAPQLGAARDGSGASSPWRADLTALERQLRAEFRPGQFSSSALLRAPGVNNDAPQPAANEAMMRRVRAIVEESERRQQRELALRVAELIREVNTQRQADLVKIDRNLGLIQNNTGVEMLKQRELLNYYLVRASQKQ